VDQKSSGNKKYPTSKAKSSVARVIASALTCQASLPLQEDFEVNYQYDDFQPTERTIIVQQLSEDFTLDELTLNTHEREIEYEREVFFRNQKPLVVKGPSGRDMLPVAFGGDGMCMMGGRPYSIEGQGRHPIIDTVYTENEALDDRTIQEDYFAEYKVTQNEQGEIVDPQPQEETDAQPQGQQIELRKQQDNFGHQTNGGTFNEEDLILTDGEMLHLDNSKHYVEIGSELSDLQMQESFNYQSHEKSTVHQTQKATSDYQVHEENSIHHAQERSIHQVQEESSIHQTQSFNSDQCTKKEIYALQTLEDSSDYHTTDRYLHEQGTSLVDGASFQPEQSKQIGHGISEMDDMHDVINHPITKIGKE